MAKKGQKLSEETKRKISINHAHHWISKKRGPLPREQKEKIIKANTNNPKRMGKNHWHWKGGITPLRKKLYFSEEYKLWRKAVFERDKYICIWCGQVGGKLNADHIKPWTDYPELRFAIDNGRTLCLDCHKKTDTWGAHK